MILETNDMFAVTWKADKYDKMRIFRKGLWDEKCKQWISKQGDRLLTYFDIDKNDYRTAKNYSIIYDTESKVQ
jgi:hypothetical protein